MLPSTALHLHLLLLLLLLSSTSRHKRKEMSDRYFAMHKGIAAFYKQETQLELQTFKAAL
jgi:hypothetical protein